MTPNKINDSAKLHSFARYVTNDASQQRAALERELDEKWARMIDETEMALYEQAYEKIQRCRADITHATNEALSREKLACKRALAVRRGEIMDEVIDEVRRRLDEFVGSEDYYPWLLGCARKAVAALGDGSIVLYLSNTDSGYAERLSSDTGCRTELLGQTQNMLGGIKAVNIDTRTAVNLTLYASLAQQREELLKISKLSI